MTARDVGLPLVALLLSAALALALFDRSMRRTVEPGELKLMVGPSSIDLQSVTLTLSAD